MVRAPSASLSPFDEQFHRFASAAVQSGQSEREPISKALPGQLMTDNRFYFDQQLEQYLRPGERYALYMAPIKVGRLLPGETLSPLTWLALLQDSMHNLLESFLNAAAWTRQSRYLYPVWHSQERVLSSLLDDLAFVISRVRTALPHSFPTVEKVMWHLHDRSVVASWLLAELLAAFYQDFAQILPQVAEEAEPITVEVRRVANESVLTAMDASYFAPVLRFGRFVRRHLASYTLGVYLHGSLSTLDYVKGYSDFDTLIVLRQDVVTDASTLLRCRQEMLRSLPFLHMIDPLQHHGHMVISEPDMHFYPQHYFPFVLFEYATSLFGAASSLVFRERDSTLERHHMLWRFCQAVRRGVCAGQRIRSLYEWKSFVQGIALLPTVYLQAAGIYTYKKFSFERAKGDFSEHQWRVIDQITALRCGWDSTHWLPSWIVRFLSLLPNPFVLSSIYRRLNCSLPSVCRTLIGEDLVCGALSLSEAMLAARLLPTAPGELNSWGAR